MNGISFAEYIHLQKLTLARYDLKSTKMKIVDIRHELKVKDILGELNKKAVWD